MDKINARVLMLMRTMPRPRRGSGIVSNQHQHKCIDFVHFSRNKTYAVINLIHTRLTQRTIILKFYYQNVTKTAPIWLNINLSIPPKKMNQSCMTHTRSNQCARATGHYQCMRTTFAYFIKSLFWFAAACAYDTRSVWILSNSLEIRHTQLLTYK